MCGRDEAFEELASLLHHSRKRRTGHVEFVAGDLFQKPVSCAFGLMKYLVIWECSH